MILGVLMLVAHAAGLCLSQEGVTMSTEGLITMLVAWMYITGSVVYFFAKLLRKSHEEKKRGE